MPYHPSMKEEWIPIDYEPEAEEAQRRPPRRAAVEVLFADETIVVANKPADLPAWDVDDEADSLRSELKLPPEAAPVYWIDDGASGIAVLAKSDDARRSFSGQRDSGRLSVELLAIVRATLPGEGATIDEPILPSPTGGRARVSHTHGRPAATPWRTVDAYAGYALLECAPRTDERHQVRLHLQATGMPLAVDPLYGGGRELMLSSFKPDYRPSRRHEERPLIARLTLHVVRVAFDHPKTAEPMRFEAQPPRDFRAAVTQLGKYGRERMPGDDSRPRR